MAGPVEGGTANTFLTDADYHLAVPQNDWPALYQRWKDWAAELTDDAARSDISYSHLRGNPYRQPLGQLVLHVVNHGTWTAPFFETVARCNTRFSLPNSSPR